jgi:hypothetical protein
MGTTCCGTPPKSSISSEPSSCRGAGRSEVAGDLRQASESRRHCLDERVEQTVLRLRASEEDSSSQRDMRQEQGNSAPSVGVAPVGLDERVEQTRFASARE